MTERIRQEGQAGSSCVKWEEFPVYLNADIVVCGGGSAGAFAAMAAAREGADVLLVESEGYLGGSAVGAYVELATQADFDNF